ncbi:hypothetical protein [Bosea sp. NBC_00550]|uniref:hypothetical protein n=2 Tax=Bacteria TaxID=2 RepID=UPI002231726D|nr:hypothetical protein [Bosea sp. NBC_00550]UZF92672.1 hypothetical protein NWE53_00125 [Bosea sp. NBC_00550]
MMPTSSSSGSVSCVVPGISEDDIRAQLGRILASDDFKVPERVRRFLSFVVEETLFGRADRIKAYAIAVEVFGRRADFDVSNDPVVRIEAGRLRRGLERYYLLEGSTDPLVIEITKGGYVPSFRWRLDDQEEPAPLSPSDPAPDEPPRSRTSCWPWRNRLVGVTAALAIIPLVATMVMAKRPAPTQQASLARPAVVVKPFVSLTRRAEAEAFAAQLSDELLSHLAPRGELTVFRGEALSALDPPPSAVPSNRSLGNRHILEGVIRTSDSKVRITSLLLDSETSAIIWSGSYEADLNSNSAFELETGLASRIAEAVSSRLRLAATVQ